MICSFNILLVNAIGPVYIRADGSIDPPTAPIQRNGEVYVLTGNITSDADGIVVEKNSIVVEGAGYAVQGMGSGKGIDLTNKNDIAVRNMRITGFDYGIWLSNSSGNTLSYNHASLNNWYGIFLQYSSNNSLFGNIASTNNNHGIYLYHSSNNTLSGNIALNNSIIGISLYHSANSILCGSDASNNYYGIDIDYSSNNTIHNNTASSNSNSGIKLVGSSYAILSDNKVKNNTWSGVSLGSSSNHNSIRGNNIIDNGANGILLHDSQNNTFCHNNFINNTVQVEDMTPEQSNLWDNGCEGNYWSDYNGTDANHDGIGDTPYVIDANNTDHYPLVTQYAIPEFPSFLLFPLIIATTVSAIIMSRKKYSRFTPG